MTRNSKEVFQLISSTIVDYQCVGSNLWQFFCLMVVPNLMVII